MNKHIVLITLLSLLMSFTNLHLAGSDAEFGAYHTHISPSPVGHIGKYEDLMVTLGTTNRLEFTRANGYQPQWRTARGVYRVESPISDTPEDPNCNYSYVRLIENGSDKIKDIRQGVILDTDGTKTMVIWLESTATSAVIISISGAQSSCAS